MKKLICLVFLITPLFLFSQNNAVIKDGKYVKQEKQQKRRSIPNPWRLGGNLGLDIGSGDYIGLSVSPRLGYRIIRNLEAGVSVGYQYSKRHSYKRHLLNFGPYLTYYPIPQFFARVEYEHYTGTQKNRNNGKSRHIEEDALWLGAGYHTTGRVRFHFGLMYNVLQNDSKLFKNGLRPIVGVSIGI